MTNHNPYIVGALAAPFIVAVGTAAVASSLWAAREVEEACRRSYPRLMRDRGNRAELAAAVATCKAVIGFRIPSVPGVVLLTVGRTDSQEALRACWMIEKELKEAHDG